MNATNNDLSFNSFETKFNLCMDAFIGRNFYLISETVIMDYVSIICLFIGSGQVLLDLLRTANTIYTLTNSVSSAENL